LSFTDNNNTIENNVNKEFYYMKATGIVRRIDDLGRVVIPKEIRRTMRIREGDPLEIYTASDGEVIFKKYSPIGELSEFASQYTDVLNRATNLPVIITDRDHVIAVSGMPKKDALDKRISTALEDMIEDRETYVASPDIKALYPLADSEKEAGIAYPIIGGGDVAGAVVLMLNPDGSMPTQTEVKLISVAASFLGKQTEE
jgi:AbrB family transcriptional regulator (stage V sporulation protein T)